MAKTNVIVEPGKQEITISRIFNAPRELVFSVSMNPAHIAEWWGPKRFTTIVDKMDRRQGGIWRFINRDSDGNEFAFKGVS